MSGVRERGEEIRRYIIEKVEQSPNSISREAASHFKITRQAVNKHLQRLTAEKILTETGNTRSRIYKLAQIAEWSNLFYLEGSPTITESWVWTTQVREALGNLPDNVMNIWNTAFTEMFNNAIDHSEGTTVYVSVKKNAAETEMYISDNGIGIFRKIQNALNLLDERHSVLELAKGKFTTDRKNHSGEGIFFTSRMMDSFCILSGSVVFSHSYGKKEDWIHERKLAAPGTGVFLNLHNHTARTTTKVYDQFMTDDDLTFSKTIVPVELARYGDDNLVSRSQAKRLLARIELFKTVVLDFTGVPIIGQAFADEIYRVFAKEHPGVEFVTYHASSEVKRMIARVMMPLTEREPLPQK